MQKRTYLRFDTDYSNWSALVSSRNVEGCIVDVDFALVSIKLDLEEQMSVTLE